LRKKIAIHIPKILRKEPRQNFNSSSTSDKKELKFVISFAREFYNKFYQKRPNSKDIFIARELPMNGYGIADLVIYIYPSETKSIKRKSPSTLISFEMKLSDWRKGLAQATKYKYFSNQSVVVLPDFVVKRAFKFVNNFKELKVGLWSYSEKTRKTRKYYTPKRAGAINNKLYNLAIDKITDKIS